MSEKHISARSYFFTWLALLILTTLTLVLSFAHLGQAEVVVALLIATAKGVLIALIFMHLLEHRFINAFVLILMVLYVALLTVFMITDVTLRNGVPPDL